MQVSRERVFQWMLCLGVLCGCPTGALAGGTPGSFPVIGYYSVQPNCTNISTAASIDFTNSAAVQATSTVSQLTGGPSGRRAVNINGLVVQVLTNPVDYVFFDTQAATVASSSDAYFRACVNAGLTGPSAIDILFSDAEGFFMPSTYSLGTGTSTTWQKYKAMEADRNFPSLKADLQAAGYQADPNHSADFLYAVNYSTTPFAADIFDEVQSRRGNKYFWTAILVPAQKYYPNIKFSNYDDWAAYANMHFGACDLSGYFGGTVGRIAPQSNMRSMGNVFQPESYGELWTVAANYAWRWPSDTWSQYFSTPFHGLQHPLNKARSSALVQPATQVSPIFGWPNKDDTGEAMAYSNYWQELILHDYLLYPLVKMPFVWNFFSTFNNYSTTSTISTTGVTNAAPAAVYQSWYESTHGTPAGDTETFAKFTHLTPNTAYSLRLHFMEDNSAYEAVGARVFNVEANYDTTLLSNFDIYASAGNAMDKAVVKTVTATSDANGQLSVQLVTGASARPGTCCGVEIVGGTKFDCGVDDYQAVSGWLGEQVECTSTQETLINNVLRELDSVAGYSDRQTLVTDLSGGSDQYILSGIRANNQHIWRITPDTSAGVTAASFRTSISPPTFAIGHSKITFPAGSAIITPTTEYAPMGYWVSSPLGTYPTVTLSKPWQINFGGAAVGPFSADSNVWSYTWNVANSSTTDAISTTGVAYAAPASVYQSGCYSGGTSVNGKIVIPMLQPGANYLVRLHLSDLNTSPITIAANNIPIVTNLTGLPHRTAVVQQAVIPADRRGQIVVQLTSGDLCGLEVLNTTANGESLFDNRTQPTAGGYGEGQSNENSNAPSAFTNGVLVTRTGQYGQYGTVFTPKVNGTITMVRAYSLAQESGSHTVRLWRVSDGAKLYETTWTYGGSEGWVSLNIPPQSVSANAAYVVSVSTGTDTNHCYPSYTGYISSNGGYNGMNLTWTPNAGVSTTSSAAMPSTTDGGFGTCYLRDVVFTTTTAPNTIFTTQLPIANGSDRPYELGTKFVANQNGYITTARFFKVPGESGTHTARIWTSSGSQLGSVVFTSETAFGWQTATFTAPIAISGKAPYMVSVNSNTRYGRIPQGLASVITNGSLSTVADGANGLYSTSTGSFPNTVDQNSNFLRDVIFTPGGSGQVTSTGLTLLTTQTPAGTGFADRAYEIGLKFRSSQAGTINGFRFWKDAAETGSHTSKLWSATGTLLGSATYSGETASRWQTATLTTPISISANTTYIISVNTNGHYVCSINGLASSIVNGALSSVADGANGVYTQTLNTFPTSTYRSSNYFTDIYFSPTVPLLTSVLTRQTPAGTGFNDGVYELGMKFKSSQAGKITKVKFWKDAAETGTHTGKLWSSTGTLLGSVAFSGETTSGWQTATLSSPISITANTVYVVSVNTNGHYVGTDNGLTSSIVNGVLSSVVDGVNGVYNQTLNAFPTSTYQGTNYFVDVVYTP